MVPSFVSGSRPMNRFSATLRLGHRFTSWYTVEMPFFWASRVEWLRMGRCSAPIKISPFSKLLTPVRHLIRVDFPAPFSPISAWISPSRSVKSTLSSAFTPGNVMQIPRMLRIT